MKVYHITEAPRIEPPVGSLGDRPTNRGPSVSGGGNTPRLTSVDITDTGILDRNGNKIFKVVDQDGKELFRGNEAQANDKRDTLRRNIRPAATAPAATDRTAGSATRDEPAASDDSKATDSKRVTMRQRVSKILKPTGVLSLLGLVPMAADLYSTTGKYYDALEAARGDTTQQPVIQARAAVVAGLSNQIVAVITGIASGVVAVSVATRALAVIPGWGWVVALISAGVGWLVSTALQVLVLKDDAINAVSNYLMKTIDHRTLASISGIIHSEETEISNEVDTKSAMKQAIMSDPELMKAFKMAKEIKAKATAS